MHADFTGTMEQAGQTVERPKINTGPRTQRFKTVQPSRKKGEKKENPDKPGYSCVAMARPIMMEGVGCPAHTHTCGHRAVRSAQSVLVAIVHCRSLIACPPPVFGVAPVAHPLRTFVPKRRQRDAVFRAVVAEDLKVTTNGRGQQMNVVDSATSPRFIMTKTRSLAGM